MKSLIGQGVCHEKYGNGVIEGIKEGKSMLFITVKFENKSDTIMFDFPNAFKKFLRPTGSNSLIPELIVKYNKQLRYQEQCRELQLKKENEEIEQGIARIMEDKEHFEGLPGFLRPKGFQVRAPIYRTSEKEIEISEIIGKAFEELTSISKQRVLCDMNGANFIWTPDYSNPDAQLLYILRYMYSYGYEYKQMYSTVIDDMRAEEIIYDGTVNVHSIGCGSAIDCWSLNKVLNNKSINSDTFKYVGIDINRWTHSYGKLDKEIIHKNIVDYYRSLDSIDASILILPKSIGDM